MFLYDAEQVFILVFDVWMRFRENRSKMTSILILVTAFLYKFVGQLHIEILKDTQSKVLTWKLM